MKKRHHHHHIVGQTENRSNDISCLGPFRVGCFVPQLSEITAAKKAVTHIPHRVLFRICHFFYVLGRHTLVVLAGFVRVSSRLTQVPSALPQNIWGKDAKEVGGHICPLPPIHPGFLAMLFPGLAWRRATQIFTLLEPFDFIHMI